MSPLEILLPFLLSTGSAFSATAQLGSHRKVFSLRDGSSTFSSARSLPHIKALTLRGGASTALHVNLLNSYSAALSKFPLLTNMITAATLATFSDTIAQSLEASPTRDLRRTASMAAWGATVAGYGLTFWFALLGRLFPLASTSNKQLFGKVLFHQLIMSPLLNAGFFAFVVLTRDTPVMLFTEEKWVTLRRKIRYHLPGTIARSCVYWSVVQTINFRYLPVSCLTLVSNVAFLLWNIYLSIVGYRKA